MSFRNAFAAAMRRAAGASAPGRRRVALMAVAATLVVSACSVTSVLTPTVDVGSQTASVSSQRGLARLVPSNPTMVGFPRLNDPLADGGAMPASEQACRRELRRLRASYRDIARIDDGGGCGIEWPVEVSGFSGGIDLRPAATLHCEMALAFARWTRDDLASAARWRYLSGVRTIHQGSSYSCRRIRGTATPSEHSRGRALDVMRIELKNGRDIDVRKPGWFSFRQRGFLNTVRADGCSHFTTVLGPGYDADHADHFHFDIKERRNGYRACR